MLVSLIVIVAETTKKEIVAKVPITNVSQEIGPPVPGINAPTTTDPKIILAPSRKNSENAFKYSLGLIVPIYQTRIRRANIAPALPSKVLYALIRTN